MNVDEASGVGFFGKIPVLGDFVSRRLPKTFIEPWDRWLQLAMRSGQEKLGENWPSLFLDSPIWRFALSPGIFGSAAWAGVIMPSVDRQGRYYPLTLARSIDVELISTLFLPDSNWFQQLEVLGLSVLNEDFDFQTFDQAAMSVGFDDYISRVRFESQNRKNSDVMSGMTASRYELENLNQIELAFSNLSQNLVGKLYTTYSFWAASDNRLNRSRFLCCEGMPPFEVYASFLQLLPENIDWDLKTYVLKPLAGGVCPQDQTHREQDDHPTFFAELDLDLAITQPSSHAPLESWASYGMTVVGNKRKHNEDAMLLSPVTGMWVVADGMGGHHSGDLASRLIVEGLADLEAVDDLEKHVGWVSSRLNDINSELCRYAADLEQGCVVGSTVVVLLAKGCFCSVIWAGDSRLYRFRRGNLSQITHDHTLVDELMGVGMMTREEALQHVGANVITRAVGGHADLELDDIRFMAEAGDRYLLCSDGLDKELSEDEISSLMVEGDCRSVVENLIARALDKNGRDNITVVVAEFR